MLLRALNLEARVWWTEYCKMGMRFRTWNVRSLHRSGSLKTVAGELVKCRLQLMGVWEVRWYKDVTEPTEDYIFFYRTGNCHQLQKGVLVLKHKLSFL